MDTSKALLFGGGALVLLFLFYKIEQGTAANANAEIATGVPGEGSAISDAISSVAQNYSQISNLSSSLAGDFGGGDDSDSDDSGY
jgi:hypothetical protein